MVNKYYVCPRFCRGRAFCIMVVSYVLYIIFGGLVFMVLEKPQERALLAEVRRLRLLFLEQNRCLQEKRLDQLLKKALFAGKRRIAVLDADADELNNDFTSSLFFVTTYLTTTGYGNTVPLSDEGKVFCVLYCLVGMPLTMLLMSSSTQRLLPFVTHAPVCHLQERWGMSYAQAALLHAGLLLTCTALLFFLLPAAGLCLLERDWSFLESLYFCFISLSTIGLGDYLPGRTRSLTVRRGLEFATSCYLLLGLVVLLVVLETMLNLPQIRSLVRFVNGPREGPLMGVDMDELVLSESSLSPGNQEDGLDIVEVSQYTMHISTISPSITEEPPALRTQFISSTVP
ncbi:potassium channel, subfamily K, member 7 isoform X1 [Brienomyrus brachyistius]|uniref:potassium channel, subfamily K, member 7 isoform X1 n=1 Tax=Brienomyrus brachyistius TaxID=42636 RepID=UPI0020B3765E|nr:potassium channel, subfamily K, member 7 isoform X1 [Brienomyrus brachyistius]